MNYEQLSFEERVLIGLLFAAGLSMRCIGKEIGRSASTISREVRRNSSSVAGLEYQSRCAENQAKQRRIQARKFPRLKNTQIRGYVCEKLRCGWSPELISGRLSRDIPGSSISHEAIYQYIYSEEPALITSLPQARRRRQRRRRSKNHGGVPIPQRVSIEKRPANVLLREEPGHWEIDTALSSNNGKTAILVAVERVSRCTRIAKIPSKTSLAVEQALVRVLSTFPESLRKTLTYDNGPENSRHLFVNAALNTDSYFCHPYHSWEKGSVENTISLIRRRLRKQRNFDTISEHTLAGIQEWINNRPKKCLDFRTPNEMMGAYGVALTP